MIKNLCEEELNMNSKLTIKTKTQKIHEKIIVILMFFPSLYYSLANLYRGFTILYFLCFVCGAISYILLIRRAKAFLITISLIIFSLLYASLMNGHLFAYIFSSASLIEFSKSKLVLLIFIYLPTLVTCLSKKLDYGFILNRMFICSIIILPLDIIIGVQRITNGIYKIDYMTIAYEIFFWSMFCFFGMIEKKKVWPLILVIPSTTLIIVGGSRGALLCLTAVLLLLYCKRTFFVPHSKLKKGRIVVSYLLFLCAIIIALNISDVINSVLNILGNIGYSSRTLNSILSFSFLNNEDRISLQAYLYPHLLDPVFGSGIYSDRFLVPTGQHAHNLFLELLIDFGLIAVPVILAIIWHTIKAIRISIRLKNSYMQYLCIYSIVTIFGKFMFSASYLESTEVFLALGLLYNITTLKRQRSDEYES